MPAKNWDNLGKVVRFPESEARDHSKPLRPAPNPSAHSEVTVGAFRRRRSDRIPWEIQWGPLVAIGAGAALWVTFWGWVS